MNSKDLLKGCNEATRKRNPNLFPVAERVRAEKPKSDERGEGEDKGVETSTSCVRYRVVFTVYRQRLLDSGDNDASALKVVRDRVAEQLGYPNDSGKYFLFEYHQIKSSTVQGVHILIIPL